MFNYTNELIHESSPYLLQHAHNPVNWNPWGAHALKKAKDENKMLIISVGYSACHWCHVMERESFEDTTVALIMNEHFVCIKVDREERPDVDQLYMNAAFLIAGKGGWPLNVLALQDGKPFFAGTYFSKDNWIKVLQYFIDIQKNNPSAINEQADIITKGIKSTANNDLIQEKTLLTRSDLDEIFNKLKPTIDFNKGGLNQTTKFPMPSSWEYLMHYSSLSNNTDALKAVTITLDNMASGGIYDHIGGGFSRYATDENWHVPHFEKMLYDNAQLVSLYAHAWQLTKDPLYKNVVYRTLEFINRELTSPEGGFYSSLDADSEDEEGKFYVWTKEEIESLLGEETPLFLDYFNITKTGNWEHGKNILYRKLPDEIFADQHKITLIELHEKIDRCRERIMKARNKRERPGLDDKVLTSWNALMVRGYVDAYRAFGEERFLKSALNGALYISMNAIKKEYEIIRNCKSGSSVPGLLDDYSFTISAFIALYQATLDEEWLYKAKELTDYTLVHFFNISTGMFYYTHDQHADLIVRKMEIEDNVIPSSNSEMAKNLLFLGHYFYDEDFIQKARQMFINVQKDLHQHIYFYSNWGTIGIHFIKPLCEVAIVGAEWDGIRKTFDRNYLPDVIFLGGDKKKTLKLLENKMINGQTTIYVCQDKTCKLPVTDVAKALQQINQID